MFSTQQKRQIAGKIQVILQETGHPELPEDEIRFHIHIKGKEGWSWADIHNNKAVEEAGINPWNEAQNIPR